jgi:hypothetical protein
MQDRTSPLDRVCLSFYVFPDWACTRNAFTLDCLDHVAEHAPPSAHCLPRVHELFHRSIEENEVMHKTVDNHGA